MELLCVTDLPVPKSERPPNPEQERALLTRLKLQGCVLALAEEPAPPNPAALVCPGAASHELASHHVRPPRSYVLITTEGAQRVRKRRPLDEIREACRFPTSALAVGAASPVEAVFHRYTEITVDIVSRRG